MASVMVTGATGGIGSAVAGTLISGGYHVTAVGRDRDGLDRLRTLGAEIIIADLARAAALREAVPSPDRLDALIHCAGVSEVAAIGDAEPAVWAETLAAMIAWVLSAPPDSYVSELSVLPSPRA